jgi:hypothetical protein
MPRLALSDGVVIVNIRNAFTEFGKGLGFVHAKDQRRTVEGETLKRAAIVAHVRPWRRNIRTRRGRLIVSRSSRATTQRRGKATLKMATKNVEIIGPSRKGS